MIRAALVGPEHEARFYALLREAGFVPFERVPWRFYAGSREEWRGPDGTAASWCHVSWTGGVGVQVVPGAFGDEEAAALWASLTAALPMRELDGLLAAWNAAAGCAEGDASVRLSALLELATAGSLAGHLDERPGFVEAWRAALDDPHPVVRLAAIRTLYCFSAPVAHGLLDGREDAENPGIAEWRAVYAG